VDFGFGKFNCSLSCRVESILVAVGHPTFKIDSAAPRRFGIERFAPLVFEQRILQKSSGILRFIAEEEGRFDRYLLSRNPNEISESFPEMRL